MWFGFRDLWNWLGGRDSNPDTVVQSHVSYRWTTSQSCLTEGTETLSISNQAFKHTRPADERDDVEDARAD